MQVLQIFNTSLTKEILTNDVALNQILSDIEGLKTLSFDFSTPKGVEDARDLKSGANKFVKKLKEFCEPLEAEGKKISDARSKISTTLVTGKNSVIDQILSPIVEVEAKLFQARMKLVTPLADLNAVKVRLKEVEELRNYNWLIYQDEAMQVVEQLQDLALATQIKLEVAAKEKEEAETRARLEREDQIRKEEQARAAQAITNAENRAKEAVLQAAQRERDKADQEKKVTESAISPHLKGGGHVKKINNEILEAMAMAIKADGEMFPEAAKIFAKRVIVAIAKGNVPHVSIKY